MTRPRWSAHLSDEEPERTPGVPRVVTISIAPNPENGALIGLPFCLLRVNRRL